MLLSIIFFAMIHSFCCHPMLLWIYRAIVPDQFAKFVMHFMGFHKFSSLCTSAFIAWTYMAQLLHCLYVCLIIYNIWNFVYGNEFCRHKKNKVWKQSEIRFFHSNFENCKLIFLNFTQYSIAKNAVPHLRHLAKFWV